MTRRDEISDLLDSIENDDTLERKMHAFKAKKDKISRVERSQQEEINEKPKKMESTADTVVIPPVHVQKGETDRRHLAETKVIQPTSAGGKTTVFDPEKIEQVKPETNDTVVIDDQKIQTIMRQQTAQNTSGLKLERKVVTSNKKPKKAINHKKQDKKIIGIIAALVGVLVIVGCVNLATTGSIFGLLQQTSEQTQTHTSGYQRLLNWVKGYGDLSSSEKLDITTYENIYDKLTSSEKKTIDGILEKATGKDFNTLLKSAKAKKKSSSKNNNVKSAEQKAKLRSQISQLQSQLSQAQSDLDDATSKIKDTQSDMSDVQTKISSYQAKIKQYQTEVTNLQQEIANAGEGEDTSSLETQLTEAQKKLSDAQTSSEYTDLQTQYTSLQNDLATYQSNQATAQATVDSLNSQISALQQQLNALD